MLNWFTKKLSFLTGYSHTSIKKYYANTMWLFGERAVSLFLGFFVGVAVARYLMPHDYGVIAYGLTLYSMAFSFSSLGMDDIIIRDALNEPQNEGKILGTAYVFRLIASIFCFIILSFVAYYNIESGYFLPVIIIIASVLIQPANLLALYFKMIIKSKYAAQSVMVAYTLSSVIKIVLMVMQAPLYTFAAAIFVDSMFQIAVLVYFYKHTGNSLKTWKFEKTLAVYFIKKCWPLALIVICSDLNARIAALFINNILGSDKLGIYSVATKLTEVWYHIPAAVTVSMFPAMINSRSNKEEYISRISKMIYLVAMFSVAFGVSVMILSGLIIKILYGANYAEAAPVLAIFCWCMLFFSFNVITTKWIMMENHLFLGLVRSAASLLTNIAICYFLITKYGIKGAAASTLINGFLTAYLFDIFSGKTRQLFMIKTKGLVYPLIFLFKYIRR